MLRRVLSYIKIFFIMFIPIFIACFIILTVIVYCTYGMRRTFTGAPIPIDKVILDPLIFSSAFSLVCSLLLVSSVVIDDNSSEDGDSNEDTHTVEENESGNT